jgi:hypothetical protein
MAEARSLHYGDDGRVRVTQWSFARAGEATGPHVHEFDYVVIPVTGGELTVLAEDGVETSMVQLAGIPYRGTAGTSHNVVSASGHAIIFVEVELTAPVMQ